MPLFSRDELIAFALGIAAGVVVSMLAFAFDFV